ncbi:MAG: NGG1p interacting factor NIF3 [Cyclobacteriaceae bacterium]|nr:NGG1p interacting factor NIF3 [Cyclobacteriaceae bacterium]
MIMEENGRREFITTVTKALGASAVILSPAVGMARSVWENENSFTVQQIMDLIIKEIPGAPFKDTVDTLKSGSPDQIVTGIVSTSFATIEIIEKTAKLGANFIITHEPTFYTHRDETEWLESNPVYQYKRDLLKKYNIAVWRFHDYWHSYVQDGVQTGVLTTLGWEKFADKNELHTVTLSPTSMKKIVSHVKAKLGIKMVRTIGDPSQICKRVALFPGAAGVKRQVTWLEKIKPDVCIVGELSEWELGEYIRDARSKGEKISLIVLSHAVSEEPGMRRLVTWLEPRIPGIKVTHVPAMNPFSFM